MTDLHRNQKNYLSFLSNVMLGRIVFRRMLATSRSGSIMLARLPNFQIIATKRRSKIDGLQLTKQEFTSEIGSRVVHQRSNIMARKQQASVGAARLRYKASPAPHRWLRRVTGDAIHTGKPQ